MGRFHSSLDMEGWPHPKRRGAGEAQPGEETRTASNLFTSEGNLAGSSAHLCLNFLFYIMDRQWRGWKLTFYVVSESPSYSQPTLCSPHLKPPWVSMCRLSPHLLDTSVQGHWLREAPKTRPELAPTQSSLGSSVWLVFSLYPMPALFPPGCEVHEGDGMLGGGVRGWCPWHSLTWRGAATPNAADGCPMNESLTNLSHKLKVSTAHHRNKMNKCELKKYNTLGVCNRCHWGRTPTACLQNSPEASRLGLASAAGTCAHHSRSLLDTEGIKLIRANTESTTRNDSYAHWSKDTVSMKMLPREK